MLTVKTIPGENVGVIGVNRRTHRLVEEWLAGQPSLNTQAAYRRDLTAFLGWCCLTGRDPFSVAPADLHRYRDTSLREGASPATVARRLSSIGSFFRHAVASGALSQNPMAGVSRPAPPDPAQASVLDGDEVASLVDAATGLSWKTAALVTLLALDGMKLGETLGLDVDDIRLGSESVYLQLQRRGEPQEIRLSSETAAAVASYIANRTDGPLFLGDSAVSHEPARLTRFGADFIIKRAGTAAGIDKTVSANVLRRSYISAAHEAGISLRTISQHVGHSDIRDTARFVEGRSDPERG